MKRIVRVAAVLLLVGAGGDASAGDLWEVRPAHVFRYRPPEGASSVHVAGSFNNWSTNATPLADPDGDGVWEVALDLPPGRYPYKFVVNGTDWRTDPTAAVREPDGYGGENAIAVIGAAEAADVASRRGDGLVDAGAVAHAREGRYATRTGPFRIALTLRLDRDDVEGVEVRPTGRAAAALRPVAVDARYEYWRVEVAATPETFVYVLAVRDGGRTFEIDRSGLRAEGEVADQPFVLPPGGVFETPAWVREAVFYQIFPERFRNGDTSNDPPGTRPWRYEPLPRSPQGWDARYGGDLAGVEEKAGHLTDLGATAVYFNPLFRSASNHKYDHSDYYRIDEDFGGDTAFAACLAALHGRGIRVIIDGVFNHSGDQHPFFRDVAARGPDSPFYRWYRVRRWPFPAQFTADGPNAPRNYYDCWWGFGRLPDWNTENPDVRQHLLGAVEKWTRAGIDGWRLDVPNEVEHDFWVLFRGIVRRLNPDAYIVGEIWENGEPWLRGDQFDATTNYPFRAAARDFFAEGKIDAAAFADRVGDLAAGLPPQVVAVQFNLLSSHDSERFWTIAGGRADVVRQAVAFQMSFPGVPSIYYGEEVGMAGGADPDNRRCFPWDEPEAWDRGLLAFYRRAIALRKEHPALRALPYYTLLASGRTYAAARLAEDGGERAVVVFHAADTPEADVEVPLDAAPLGLPDGTWTDLLGGGTFEARGGRLRLGTLNPRASLWLVPRGRVSS